MNYYRKTTSLFSVAAALCALTLFGPGAEGATYDLSADFSATSNPSGAWSYGYMTTLGGTFSLFTVNHPSTSQNGVPVDFWAYSSTTEPSIWRNDTTSTASSDGMLYPPGTVMLSPGGGGTLPSFGVARFTVPQGQAGTYLLQTTIEARINGGSLASEYSFHVLDNGGGLFDQFMPPSSGTNYSSTLNLAAGDRIDFVAGPGADGSWLYSGIQIQATLTLVPEPSSAGLLAAGLFLLSLRGLRNASTHAFGRVKRTRRAS